MPARAVTATYAQQVDKVATETRQRLLRIWDSCAPWGPEDIDRFHDIAEPLIRAAAQAGVDLSTTYLEHVLPDVALRTVSPLLVDDAAARLYDPADRIGKLITNGASFEEATAAARDVVDTLGHNTVYNAARQSTGELAISHTEWTRQVGPKCCDWCLSFAGEVWYSAAGAGFGHDNDKCLPVPSGAADNQAFIDQAGGETAVKKYKQASGLRRSEKTARRRQAEAKAEQLTETDPVRLERLSIREQEWETRAERAAERLQLLTAP